LEGEGASLLKQSERCFTGQTSATGARVSVATSSLLGERGCHLLDAAACQRLRSTPSGEPAERGRRWSALGCGRSVSFVSVLLVSSFKFSNLDEHLGGVRLRWL